MGQCNDTNWFPLQSNSPVALQWTRVIIKLTPYNAMTPIDPVLQYAQSLLIQEHVGDV